MTKSSIQKLALSGLFLALCLLLPFLTGQIPQIGNMLLPMHLPVFLCGFICGWPYGLAVGFIAPLMRSALFVMPPMPAAIAMAFEMACYGAVSGWLYRLLPKKVVSLYLSLIGAMLSGRAIWGIAQWIVTGFAGTEFGLAIFLSGAFTTAVPGIILQLVLIPLVMILLQKAKVIQND